MLGWALVKLLILGPESSFLGPKTSFLDSKSMFLTPESSFLVTISRFLTPESNFLGPESSFLVKGLDDDLQELSVWLVFKAHRLLYHSTLGYTEEEDDGTDGEIIISTHSASEPRCN